MWKRKNQQKIYKQKRKFFGRTPTEHMVGIFTGSDGFLSARRVITFLSFTVMLATWFLNMFFGLSVAPFIFDGFLWIIGGGIFGITAGSFGSQWTASKYGMASVQQPGSAPFANVFNKLAGVVTQSNNTAAGDAPPPVDDTLPDHNTNPAEQDSITVTDPSTGEQEPDPNPTAPTASE